MPLKEPFSVLVAPLDWGLGHATRCIPIVKELILQGARVVIASAGPQKTLLQSAFPLIEFIDLPGYRITYKPGFLLKWGILLNFKSIVRQIKRENKWLAEAIRVHKIDAVISDNRFGLYHSATVCVFITHQLNIQSGLNLRGEWSLGSWAERIIQRWNYKSIRNFSLCWVPDEEPLGLSMAGILSHPSKLPEVPVKYIGVLSRFKATNRAIVENSLLVIISGPEPQRTQFENMLFAQLADCTLETVVVRGLPGSAGAVPFINHCIRVFNHADAVRLNELLTESAYIIARSGYSTIMDLVRLRKTAILIPTPGQPEQEYLARHMTRKKWMYAVQQKHFNLTNTLEEFQKQKLFIPEMDNGYLSKEVGELLESIRQRQTDILS